MTSKAVKVDKSLPTEKEIKIPAHILGRTFESPQDFVFTLMEEFHQKLPGGEDLTKDFFKENCKIVGLTMNSTTEDLEITVTVKATIEFDNWARTHYIFIDTKKNEHK